MENPVLLPNQSAFYFSVTAIDFEKCYKVRKQRIKHGLSDRDLAFLLGFEPRYVKDIEDPTHSKRYKPKDTNYLLHIFDCELPEIMGSSFPRRSYDLCVIATATPRKPRTFDIYIKQPNGKWKSYLNFTELAENEYLLPRSKANTIDVQEYLLSLLAEGYLDSPKTGLELYRKCIAHFDGHIKPVFIASSVREINKQDNTPIGIDKNSTGRWVYRCVVLEQ